MPSDPTKWPINSSSNLVDTEPIWRQVAVWTNWPLGKLRQVSATSLKQLTTLNLFDNLDPQTKDAIIAIIEGRPLDTTEISVITPERLTSLVDASNRAELARGAIDIVALLNLAVSAIVTGDLCGAQLDARTKVDLLKWLGNKSLADMRNIEQSEVVQRVDRGRRRAADMTGDDLKKLSRQELLDLMDA